ncbi:MAG: hypothetical protein WBV81_17940 [Ignavibacteriaceae bacterium]
MYKYLAIILVLTLFAVGCTDESNMITPVDNNVSNSEVVSSPNWISLPPAENQALKKDITVGKTIYGDQESLLEINTGYAGGPFGWISITANARFQRYSFTGSRYVTMSINDDFGAATFTPSGVWARPVIYNLTIQGIDLSSVDPSKVSFVYMAPDGNYYKAKYQSIYVEKQSGKLQIINAELPHFSRWGFIN